jgi:hypothetical protein
MSLVSQRYGRFVIHTLGSAAAILIVVVLVQEGVEWLVCGVCGGGFAVWQGRIRAFHSRVESRVERRALFASRPAGSLEDEANDNSFE